MLWTTLPFQIHSHGSSLADMIMINKHTLNEESFPIRIFNTLNYRMKIRRERSTIDTKHHLPYVVLQCSNFMNNLLQSGYLLPYRFYLPLKRLQRICFCKSCFIGLAKHSSSSNRAIVSVIAA